MAIQKRKEELHREYIKKKRKRNHLTIKTQTEHDRKAPNKTKQVEKEIHVENSEKQRRIKSRCYIRIMNNIINAI